MLVFVKMCGMRALTRGELGTKTFGGNLDSVEWVLVVKVGSRAFGGAVALEMKKLKARSSSVVSLMEGHSTVW